MGCRVSLAWVVDNLRYFPFVSDYAIYNSLIKDYGALRASILKDPPIYLWGSDDILRRRVRQLSFLESYGTQWNVRFIAYNASTKTQKIHDAGIVNRIRRAEVERRIMQEHLGMWDGPR